MIWIYELNQQYFDMLTGRSRNYYQLSYVQLSSDEWLTDSTCLFKG